MAAVRIASPRPQMKLLGLLFTGAASLWPAGRSGEQATNSGWSGESLARAFSQTGSPFYSLKICGKRGDKVRWSGNHTACDFSLTKSPFFLSADCAGEQATNCGSQGGVPRAAERRRGFVICHPAGGCRGGHGVHLPTVSTATSDLKQLQTLILRGIGLFAQ